MGAETKIVEREGSSVTRSRVFSLPERGPGLKASCRNAIDRAERTCYRTPPQNARVELGLGMAATAEFRGGGLGRSGSGACGMDGMRRR